jgi:spore maturation protein A
MVAVAVVYGLISGSVEAVAKGAFDGAASAVELSLSMAGIMCLWTGVMSVMQKSGLAGTLARLMSPFLKALFPSARHDRPSMEAISANVSANLLGLGNAATPLGIKAARRLQQLNGGGTQACADFSMLLVLNTASIQLIPATIAALRVSMGSTQPFSVLPHVWIASACALLAALLGMVFCRRFLRSVP